MVPPGSTSTQFPITSPSDPPLQIDEGIEVLVNTTASTTAILETDQSQIQPIGEETTTAGSSDPRSSVGSSSKSMNEPNINFPQEELGELVASPSVRGTQFTIDQFLTPTSFSRDRQGVPGLLDPDESFDAEVMDVRENNPTAHSSREYLSETYPVLNVTRQEVTFLANFLGRIPGDFLTGGGTEPNQALSLAIVDNVMDTAPQTTSSQEDQPGTSLTGTFYPEEQEPAPLISGKRRRPRYSLTVSMLKKHPVLKFAATGPLDASKTPYKWWCRVCRTELSLMSRGPLEIVSHYRSDTHLIREHRIRMEIPGMPLFDKDEKEILGIELQNARRVAKETHPIAHQLDGRHPLVGQSVVPAPNFDSSPTEKVLFQISIIEYGLRHGGSMECLTGIYEELARLTPTDQFPSQNWSPQRLFVSIIPLHSHIGSLDPTGI